MTAEWAESVVVKIGRRRRVTMTMGPGGFACEWSPLPRDWFELSKREQRRYMDARNTLAQRVANRMRAGVAVVDIGTGRVVTFYPEQAAPPDDVQEEVP